ncbi:hypothetical protein E4U13_008009 [Claviceps humidiphila]|uniref:Uncharacterized protein n=1 Tax=Claviceps humidiphila TaxID=1294629 RepID=A0A9P7PXW8_9HYPO|nr:hypothetical protein E4U13_008009 [Claviceps humidiphila]
MASNTRSSARASATPESQTNPPRGGQSQAGEPPSDPATTTMETLQQQLAMERVQEEIAQSQARRRAYDRGELAPPNPAPNAQGPAMPGAPLAMPSGGGYSNHYPPRVPVYYP